MIEPIPNVSAATTPRELNRALTLRAAEAFDKTRSTRELAMLARLLLDLLREGRALDRVEAAAEDGAAAAAAVRWWAPSMP